MKTDSKIHFGIRDAIPGRFVEYYNNVVGFS